MKRSPGKKLRGSDPSLSFFLPSYFGLLLNCAVAGVSLAGWLRGGFFKQRCPRALEWLRGILGRCYIVVLEKSGWKPVLLYLGSGTACTRSRIRVYTCIPKYMGGRSHFVQAALDKKLGNQQHTRPSRIYTTHHIPPSLSIDQGRDLSLGRKSEGMGCDYVAGENSSSLPKKVEERDLARKAREKIYMARIYTEREGDLLTRAMNEACARQAQGAQDGGGKRGLKKGRILTQASNPLKANPFFLSFAFCKCLE